MPGPDLVTFDRALAEEIAGECLARRSRDLARGLTRVYDDALRAERVRATQLTMLVAIGLRGPLRASALADSLDIEQSTASRNLARMRDQGWITDREDPGDARATVIHLTQAGADVIDAAGPGWREAQQRGREILRPALRDLTSRAGGGAEPPR